MQVQYHNLRKFLIATSVISEKTLQSITLSVVVFAHPLEAQKSLLHFYT